MSESKMSYISFISDAVSNLSKDLVRVKSSSSTSSIVTDGDWICVVLLHVLFRNPLRINVFFDAPSSSRFFFFFLLLILFLYTSLVAKKLPSRNTGEPKNRTSKSFEIT